MRRFDSPYERILANINVNFGQNDRRSVHQFVCLVSKSFDIQYKILTPKYLNWYSNSKLTGLPSI
jgi:hypothetical protein